jgi:hypothetical protein
MILEGDAGDCFSEATWHDRGGQSGSVRQSPTFFRYRGLCVRAASTTTFFTRAVFESPGTACLSARGSRHAGGGDAIEVYEASAVGDLDLRVCSLHTTTERRERQQRSELAGQSLVIVRRRQPHYERWDQQQQ